MLAYVELTLTHEIFEMVPFDVVGKIANVDAAILLRRLANAGHHLFLGLSTLLMAPRPTAIS